MPSPAASRKRLRAANRPIAGTTYLRGGGYEQLDNDGAMRAKADIAHRLGWVTEAGQTLVDELRRCTVVVEESAWGC